MNIYQKLGLIVLFSCFLTACFFFIFIPPKEWNNYMTQGVRFICISIISILILALLDCVIDPNRK